MVGAGSRMVPTVVLMVVCVGAILCPHRAQGQQLQCPEKEREPRNCCPCQDLSLVCLTACPDSHYETQTPPVYVCPDTIASNVTSSSSVNTSSPPPPVRCMACHDACKSCTGGQPEDCKICAKDHDFQVVNGTLKCVPQASSSGPNVGGIVGGTVAVLAAAVVMVVVMVRMYRYRRRRNMEPEPRRSISTLMGPRTKTASPALGNGDPETEEAVEQTVKKEKTASKVHSPKESIYVNVESSVPEAEAIQQGHDNIMRYSRDPTLKEGQGQSKKAGTGSLEDEEVKNLPPAPAPPGTTPLSPPENTYEIVETPAPRPTPQARPTLKQKSSPSAQAAPSQSYEIMDFPIRSDTARSSDAQAVKGSSVTLLRTGPAGKQKRRTFVEPSTSSSLPNPKASSSCPVLPRFPSEEDEETQAGGHESQSRLKHPSSSPRVLHEEPEKEYENAPSKKKKTAADTGKQELSDPEDDYQNTGPRGKLVPQVPDQGRGSGLVNPAMEVLEEPQGVYGNQDVVDDHDRYSNTPVIPPQGTVGTDDSNQVVNKEENDGQPTYGNDVSDDGGHDYQNCPRPRSKP